MHAPTTTCKPLTYQAKQLITLHIKVEKKLREDALAGAGYSSQMDQCPPGAQGPLEGARERRAQSPAHEAEAATGAHPEESGPGIAAQEGCLQL